MGTQGQGEKKRKGSEREEKKGKGKGKGKLKYGRVGKESKLVATVYTPGHLT